VVDTVEDRQTRDTLAGIALVFAELAGRLPAWERGLEGFEMTESQVVNSWIRKGETKARLESVRRHLLEALEGRFPGQASEEVIRLINGQDSTDLLEDWFRAAVRVATYEQFLEKLKE
jgi:hypothetical protein